MKRYYEEAELEIILLQRTDVITESGEDNEGGGYNPWG